MKYIFALIFLIFNVLGISKANTGEIIGTITDNSTGLGIPGVNIYIEGTTIGDFSDGKGNFEINGLPEGIYVVKISSIGYHTQSKQIQVVPNQQIELKLSLLESVEVLEGVIVDRVSLIGGTSALDDIAGSAHYLSPKELNKFSNSDINRALRRIPGMLVQEEDGFGLRPNIGMRGTGLERSSKITLMEDGILVAPAPYAAPAAYYFPSTGRMSGIEVRKGSSQIKYGPYTTGGAINFLSTPITDEKVKLSTRLIGGNFGYKDIHGSISASNEHFGIMAESMVLGSDGFKDLDNGGNTGFIKEDYLIKARIKTGQNARIYQSLTLKAGLTTETSNETYLGLSNEDFDSTPFRRYAGSQMDRMDNEQTQYSLRYIIQPARFMDITTTLYRNDFSRNWYKLDKVKAGDSGTSVGISSILSDTDTYSAEMDIIHGGSSTNDDALFVKANNRSYYSQGAESIIGLNFSGNLTNHDVEIGIRYHEDQMDRFQWVDAYKMSEGTMMKTKQGTPGTDSNYLLDARALATYVQYKFSYHNLSITPGLRYENIHYSKTDYGKNDPDRDEIEVKLSENDMDIFIPGVGVDYRFNELTNAFIGIHKGFTPSGVSEGTLPETSINYEAGLRYISNALTVQPVIFYNDYDNLLGADLASSGGSGSIKQYNGGQSLIYGLEFETSYNFLAHSNSKFSLPLSFNYTYTNATFKNDFESEFEPWGQVNKGDAIPYIPEHQFALNLGLQHKRFEVNLSSMFMGDMRTTAGQGEIQENEKIPHHFIADISTNYQLNRYISIYGGLFNAFDAVYVVSRRPAGVRPGLPRSFRFGLKANF